MSKLRNIFSGSSGTKTELGKGASLLVFDINNLNKQYRRKKIMQNPLVLNIVREAVLFGRNSVFDKDLSRLRPSEVCDEFIKLRM